VFPQKPYCEQQYPAGHDTPYGSPQAPAGAEGSGDAEDELIFELTLVLKVLVEALEELVVSSLLELDELIVSGLLELVDVDCLDVVLVVVTV
jgi:hypothetical protein